MVTLKLKPKVTPPPDDEHDRARHKTARAPVRGVGSGVRSRPTLAQARAMREDKDKQYQSQQPPFGTDRRTDKPARQDPRATPRRATRPPSNDRPERASAPVASRQRPLDSSSTRPVPTWQEDGSRPARQANTAFGKPAPGHDSPDRNARLPTTPSHPLTSSADGSLRLSKYMTELGISSRREADEWIPKGWVRVNGRVVSELGSRVMRGQQVTVDAKARFVQAQKVTVLINKPVGYVSGQAEDGYEPAYVLVKPANLWSEDHSGIRFLPQHLRSLVPAGRLDIDSVGLLVLTQDGRVAKQLIGENSAIEKEYLVRVASADGKRLSAPALALLRRGLELDGQALREAEVEWVNEDQLRFVLREGKKRQIRRMCEAVGLQVLGLKRVRIGSLMLGDLPVGQWRYLRVGEGFA